MTELGANDAALWSYRAGSWYAVFGPEVAVLLPAEQKEYVAALWSLVDGGAGFDQVLDALLASGLSGLPAFVLVSTGSGATRVLLRGPGTSASATTAEGAVAVDGSAGGTWVERSIPGVLSLTVRVDEAPDGAADLAIPAGLVRVSRIDRATVLTPVAASPAPEPAPAPRHAVEPLTEVIDAPPFDVPTPVQAPLEPSPLDSERWTEPTFAGDPLPDPMLDPFPDPDADTPPDTPLDAPVDAPVEEDATALIPPPPPPPLPVGAWEPIASGTPSTPTAPGAVAKLVVSDGQTVVVDGVVLIGRAPEARRFTADEQPQLVTVPSRLHEISSTHVEVRPGSGADLGSAVVTDMGSTNGTVLVQPGLGPEDLKPGIAVQLLPGAVINLGDGITIQVTRA